MERKIKDYKYMEEKNTFLELKRVSKLGKFSGYASVFNIQDSYKDIILPASFKKSLNKKKY